MHGEMVDSGSATMGMSTRSGTASAAATSLQVSSQSGRSSAGDLVAASAAATVASNTEAVEVQGSNGAEQTPIENPWNLFQHQHRNMGLTSSTLATMYRDRKSRP